MTDLAWLLLGVTALVAVTDWVAVHVGNRAVEYVAKPATMVFLIGVAAALDTDDGAARTWFVVALAFSLAGDVFLMLPREQFVAGLASFLVGHVAYIGGLASQGVETGGLVFGAAIIAVAVPTLGRRILGAVRAGDEPELLVPVGLYIGVISAMVVFAAGVQEAVALAGALSFYASDATIAWTRFIQDFRWGRFTIMSTYHLAQIALVASLVV